MLLSERELLAAAEAADHWPKGHGRDVFYGGHT